MVRSYRSAGFVVVLVALAALLLLACPQRSSPPPMRVRMAWPPLVASLTPFVAQRQGFFRREGVTVEMVNFANSNDMVNALVSGQLDVLPAVSLVPVVHLEIQHPGRVRLFSHSRMRTRSAFDSIIVRQGSPLQTLGDLAGRRIGVFPGTSAPRMLAAFLRRQGVDPARVTTVSLPPPAQIPSLEQGAIDALFSYEPTTTVALQRGGYRTLYGSVYTALQDPCPIGSSVVSRAFERTHPEAARRAIRAIDGAVDSVRARPTEARALLPALLPLPRDVVGAVTLVDVTRADEIDGASLQRFVDLLHEVGETPSRFDVHRLTDPTR